MQQRIGSALALAVILAAGASQPAFAATYCVNPGGTGGCSATIQAAVNKATAAGDVVQVAHGTYKEDVAISSKNSIALLADHDENTIIDATGKLNGVTITNSTAVVVSGFTVENAQTAGIWVTNSSDITISNNHVMDNDMDLGAGTCPALNGTPFAKGEAMDCGEAIFLSGVDHSLVAGNTVTGNAGGILVTDDTGATHDNLITGNSVLRNIGGDCGITMPSHSGDGVYHNTVSGNDSSYNSGPGVGIFAPGPGSKAYGNVIINNHLRGNANPGVTMHNHAAPGVNGVPAFLPQPIFNDNVILGNDISANQDDDGDAATPGTAGINIFSQADMTGTIISQNVITQEQYDIVVNLRHGGSVQAHLNNLPQNSVGLDNAGTNTTVDATENWWGCSKGPGAPGCATVVGSALTTPWLSQPFQAGGDN